VNFYNNFDQPVTESSEAVIANWWQQGMMGSAQGQYECITGFVQEDYTEDLKKISVPVLILNGEAGQVARCATPGPPAVELVQHGTLTTYPGFPMGCRLPTPTSSMGICWPSCSLDGVIGLRRSARARSGVRNGRRPTTA
jgi:hypothetical protein